MNFYSRRGTAVKVFISWSGDRSKRIAKALKKWIKNVIQSVEPFVSSEDIQKGTRWSVDLAKELQDSNFGILCVTRENFEAPWLLFEAGALSKTMDKAYVVPFLFDLNPLDLSDSPLMQFQATPFSKDEIKKLIMTMNETNGSKLDNLDEVFEKWYPDLEKVLDEITSIELDDAENIGDEAVIKSSQVLEEILSLSRDNQKLLRNSEGRPSEEFGEVIKKLERISDQNDRHDEYSHRRRKMHPMMFDEMFMMSRKEFGDSYYGFLIYISLFREDFPWIYVLGKELYDIIKSSNSMKQKDEAIRDFKHMLEHTRHFSKRIYKGRYKEDDIMLHELPMMLMEMLERMPLYENIEDSPE